MAQKLPVQFDKDMESIAGITFEACAAYYDGNEAVRVLGEAVASDGRPIQDYREIQVVVYAADGDILGRDYTNWIAFHLRQSFEIEVTNLPDAPARIRVFPSRSD